MKIDFAFRLAGAAFLALGLACHAAAVPVQTGEASSAVWSLDLTDRSQPPESAKVQGGSWTEAGWQTTGRSSQLMIELPHGIGPDDEMAIEVTIKGFDPKAQYHGKKHQFISLYSRPDGSKDGWHDQGKAWWNIRGGTSYLRDGGAGFKMLWANAGFNSRHEVRCLHEKTDWDPDQPVTFRVEMTKWKMSLYMNDEVVVHNKNFGPRHETLQYLFLGTDNVYDGFAGVTYQSVKVSRLED
jgi:hypothetical protein